MIASTSKTFALKAAERLQRSLRVEWEDGHCAQFTYVWLRDNADSRRPALVHLDLNAQPQAVERTDGRLKLVWPPFLPADYTSEFLRRHSHHDHKNAPRQYVACPFTNRMRTVPWQLTGRDLLDQKPAGIATVEWGERAHEPSTQWPHFEQIPTLVAVESASSSDAARVQLVDGVAALERLAREHPEKYAFLASSGVDYQYGPFHASHRTAQFDETSRRIVGAVFNNAMRSSEITVDQLDELYAALKAFNQICCDQIHEVRVGPSDALWIDNTRTLLGAPAQIGRKIRLRLYD